MCKGDDMPGGARRVPMSDPPPQIAAHIVRVMAARDLAHRRNAAMGIK
jgi:hypothetical protein